MTTTHYTYIRKSQTLDSKYARIWAIWLKTEFNVPNSEVSGVNSAYIFRKVG